MAVKVPITVEGNLGAEPRPGTKDDRAYTQLLVMENDRRFNEDTQAWENVGEPIMHNVVVFGQQAENVASSLHSGDRVLVAGDLHFRTYEQDGQRRQSTQIVASAVAPSLRFATADVHRNGRDPEPAGPTVTPTPEATGPVAVPQQDGWPTVSIPS